MAPELTPIRLLVYTHDGSHYGRPWAFDVPIFVPCPTCARHVATTEFSCPFCACALPRDLTSRAIPPANGRLNRAAMFTFATTVTATTMVAACDGAAIGSAYGFACTDPERCDYGQYFDSGVGFSPQDAHAPFDAYFIEDSATDGSREDGDAGDADGEDAD